MSTSGLPDPVRHLMAQLDELRFGDVPDMGAVGGLLLELAADEEFFAPLVAQMPAEQPGVRWLAEPERGSVSDRLGLPAPLRCRTQARWLPRWRRRRSGRGQPQG